MSTNIIRPKILRPLRRTAAALVCAALVGFGLAGSAGAQVTGPLATPYTSPPTPTPFQWPTFHSGGGPVPAAQYPVDAGNAPFLTPLIDPLQVQLQGTPTELYNGALTQIPSYSLGNFDPRRPPTGLSGGPGTINTFYPNHFADGTIIAWAAPLNYVAQAAGNATADDSAAAPTATTSGFAFNGGWVSIADSVANPAAGTATNGEYLRLPSGTNGTAIWTLVEPTAGTYSLYFHIPNPLPDSTGAAEVRSTQVIYGIVVRDSAGNITTAISATASQTEANDTQYLAGPLAVAAGGTVTVTLARRTTAPAINYDATVPSFLVADSMTLQQTVGDVQSAPTAITNDRFPDDFRSTTHPLQYWGVFVPPGTLGNIGVNTAPPAGSTPAEQATLNANPDTNAPLGGNTGRAVNAPTPNAGNVVLKTGVPPAAATQFGNSGLIRQLVYFGRSDPAARISSSIDDSSATRFATGAAPATNVIAPNPSAATASNGEYKSYPATGGIAPTAISTTPPPVATWTVPAPTSGAAVFAYVHIPANLSGEKRLGQVYYRVTVNTGTITTPALVTSIAAISQVAQGTDSLVLLPTGPLNPTAGTNVVIDLYNVNGSGSVLPPINSVVVADSVTLSTGGGQGAIYCVDGFTGGVIWRYETPGSANGPSSPVFSSPAVAKINVLVTPAVVTAAGVVTTPAVYANRLVVIVGDDNGQVYCLDAIGNGDGTSNVNVLAKDTAGNPVPNQPVTIPQPAYGGLYGVVAPPAAPTGPAAAAAANAHLGTTGVYWVYRPDPAQPKYVIGASRGMVKKVSDRDVTTDLPVPAAFGTASPAIFVDPTVPTPTTPGGTVIGADANAIVYIGNSNGVLYALNASGGARDGSAFTDRFNASLDVQGGAALQIPSAEPLWWFSLRGINPNSPTNASNSDIESAPSLYVKAVSVIPVAPSTATVAYLPTVYIGSAHEQEVTSNVGRLYALNGLYGPSFNGSRVSPLTQPNPAAAGYTGPGAVNYNVGQVPQTDKNDTADWSFPDANNTKTGPLTGFKSHSTTNLPRPALGNISGSPVVFTNIHNTAFPTRIYIAANSGREYPATARPDDTQTGRIWAVNLDGSLGKTTGSTTNNWVYPLANDPNDAAQDGVGEPYRPIGSFLRATPAIGFVQFPTLTEYNAGAAKAQYNPTDAFATGGISGQAVPMLYVGTRGVNDSALYAVDIDGDMVGGGTPVDTRTIYRVASPSGSIFQSSPALVTNATNPLAPAGPGNGGSVYAVAGETMYDYSATPISNPTVGEAFPLIRENRAFVGIGPISSPALAGANTTDLTAAFLATAPGAAGLTNTNGFTTNTRDWVYVGDSGSGFCRGISPIDPFYGGLNDGIAGIVPYGPTPPQLPLLDSIIKAFLVKTQASATPTDALPVGTDAALPVYEWGESVYARFSNVAPPNPANSPSLYVHDTKLYPDLNLASTSNPIPFYTSDGTTAQTVTFALSDADAKGGSVDSGSVNPRVVNTPPDGFVAYATAPPGAPQFPEVTTNLVANDGNRYLGTYSYTIADGSARSNLPGARRRFQNVKQTVNQYNFDGTNYTLAGTAVISGDATNANIITNPTAAGGVQSFSAIPAIDQPIFAVLNPLGVRAGGVPLLGTSAVAIEIGNELGPFRSAMPPPTYSTPPGGGTTTIKDGDQFTLQALANGNDYPKDAAPPSSSGVGLNPTRLANPDNNTDPTGINAPIATAVVVTSTGLIQHNTVGDNAEASSAQPNGVFSNTGNNGLAAASFGGYGLNVFDRGALFNLGQTLRVKMTVPVANQYAPSSGRDGISWNSNFSGTNAGNTDNTGHSSVVNFLPWETPPTPRVVGANGSLDYPDIAPGNIVQIAQPTLYGGLAGDLTSNFVVLPPASGTGATRVQDRTVHGDPVQMRITVPNHQSANQQLYLKTGGGYTTAGETPPVNEAGASLIVDSTGTPLGSLFPMGYVTSKRIYVPNASGAAYNRPYRDVRIYTGVPVDMRTSIGNAATDIGKVPAAFGVQTESDPAYSLFVPANPAFSAYFKPLEVRNDGNANLLNVHFDQKFSKGGVNFTLPLFSDSADLLSGILGYDLAPTGSTFGVTGPRGTIPSTTIPEQPYLIRTSVDTDLVRTYARNPFLSPLAYPGATFHKPAVGGDNPSLLTVPDAPENGTPGYTPQASGPPLVSLALPFGTPVGTYRTAPPEDLHSLRLFEGLDTAAGAAYTTDAASILYPPKYGGAVGGIGAPSVDTVTGEPTDSSAAKTPEDIFNGLQPISTAGTQLTGTVIEQRLTDGATYGAVPMIDAAPAVSNGATPPVFTSSPDFGPAAFRDPSTGNLSVYWASGRNAGGYGLLGANLPFKLDPSTADPKHGYFLPSNPLVPAAANPTKSWWTQFTPTLAAGTNSGLSISAGALTDPKYGFVVNVTGTVPYVNTLYSYSVNLTDGTLSGQQTITPPSSNTQVKYGVRGVTTGYADPVWAFWTGSTRGRTALYYNAQKPTGRWEETVKLLPVPAGLTSVADASPLLMTVPVPGGAAPVIEVTYSGTAPDGNTDLYTSRYAPDTTTPSKLNLVPFPAMTEDMKKVGGWYQAREVAWSRTGALNVLITPRGGAAKPLLYDTANAPLFTKAIYDQASGLLVLTGVNVPNGANATTTNTVYVDAATGRVRFSPALLPAQDFVRVQATFSPLARRLTTDTRPDTAPVTFLDDYPKPNDAPNLGIVNASRRWTIWRKSGSGGTGNSATLYSKTQRLTLFLPTQVDPTKTIMVKINGTAYTNPLDVDYLRGRLYFPIISGAEGQGVTAIYTDTNGKVHDGTGTNPAIVTDTVQWQDEQIANDNAQPADSAAALNTVHDYAVPLDKAINENNVAAFLDPFANDKSAHKVWLFWNSTRNGTADIYSETIDPRFAPGP